MPIRRVVTGRSSSGSPAVVSDQQLDGTRIGLMPGADFTSLWGSDDNTSFALNGSMPTFRAWFPPPGGYRFELITIPPQAAGAAPSASARDMAALTAEANEKLPGLLGHMDPDHPGFHQTETVDLIYIVSGSIDLELTPGESTRLNTGDVLVQNGTRHAWRNAGADPCTLLNVSIGAKGSV